jgi:hypothetical protein
VGVTVVKHDTSRVLMPLLIRRGTLNFLDVPKKSATGSNDEIHIFPFSNREKRNRQNIAGKMPSTISLHLVKIVTIVFFVLIVAASLE